MKLKNSHPIKKNLFWGILFFASFISINCFAQCSFTFTILDGTATCGLADGSIGVNAITGGSGNYTLAINNGLPVAPSLPPNNHVFSSLSAGTYAITISDGTCDTTVLGNVGVTFGIASASATVVDEACASLGSITVAVLPNTVAVASYTLTGGANNTTGTFTGLSAGTYSVTIIDNSGCPYVLNNIVVGLPPAPTDIDIQVTNIVCKGAQGAIDINGTIGGVAPFKYSVNGTAPSVITHYPVLASGFFTVIVTDANGCTFSKNVQVTENNSQQLKDCNAGRDTSIFFGSNVNINAIQGSGASLFWIPGSTLSDSTTINPVAFPDVTTTYTLNTTNAQGCRCLDRVTIRVVPLINIPNTFTPNGDGNNDIWIIENTALYEDVEVFVFNRWGDRVFHKNNYKPGDEWDGGLLPAATYYYIIRFKYLGDDEIFEYTGGITIIR